MTNTDASIPTGPPAAGNEIDTLLGALERQRRTFAWKTGGLDAAGLRATVGASSITLGGLLKHLTAVEDLTFAWKLLGQRPASPWDTVDWESDPDWDWHSAADDSPEQLYAMWGDAVARSVHWSRTRSPTAGWTGWRPTPGMTADHPACAAS
jgi:hypothetical protein